jgi:hypothetical protein
MSETPRKIYRIVGWNETYETAESRKLKHLFWVPVPNKHDGLGFRRLAMQRENCQLLAAWVLMVQLASRGPPERRGWLMRDGKPLDAEEMGLMTGFPASIFERALEFFSQTKIGWIVQDSPADKPASPADRGKKATQSPDAPAQPASLSGQSPDTSGDSADTGNTGPTDREVVSESAPRPPQPQEKETDDDWIARLQAAHPAIDVRTETEKALKKRNGEAFDRAWFEKSWLPKCSTKFGRGRKRAPSAEGKKEPVGWKTWWSIRHPGVKLPESFDAMAAEDQAAAWIELGGNSGKAA